jgi:hypothetical protein
MSRYRRSKFNRPIAAFRGLVVGLGRIQIHSHDFSLLVVNARSRLGLCQPILAYPSRGNRPGPTALSVFGLAIRLHDGSSYACRLSANIISRAFVFLPDSCGFFFFFGRWQDQVLDFDTTGPVLHHASALVLSDSLTLCPGRGCVR